MASKLHLDRMARHKKMAITPLTLSGTQVVTTTDHKEQTITLDLGIPHTLAPIKLRSWLPGMEKLVTLVLVI